MAAGIYIVGEMEAQGLAGITLELIALGKRLRRETGQPLTAVFIGDGITEAVREAYEYGVDRVLVMDDPIFHDYLNEPYTLALTRLCRDKTPEIVVFGQTVTGKDLSPAVAYRLDTGITLDCIELSVSPSTGLLLKTKPVYGGNALATYECEQGRPQMASIRAGSAAPAEKQKGSKGQTEVYDPRIEPAQIGTRLLGRKKTEIEGVDIEAADVVVCGGRGLSGPEPFDQLRRLAEILGGATAASRPCCDNGWVPHHYQVGLTGKVVSPSLYIGIAISGASQHLAGILGSKTVVAINKDPNANIFRAAHFGVVGDYKAVLPSLIEACSRLQT